MDAAEVGLVHVPPLVADAALGNLVLKSDQKASTVVSRTQPEVVQHMKIMVSR